LYQWLYYPLYILNVIEFNMKWKHVVYFRMQNVGL